MSVRLRIGSSSGSRKRGERKRISCQEVTVGVGEPCRGAKAAAAIPKLGNTKLHGVLLGAALLRSNLLGPYFPTRFRRRRFNDLRLVSKSCALRDQLI